MPNNGIFSLSSYYNKDISGDIPERTRETYREYGYTAGGQNPAVATQRIDFSNDTTSASIRGSLASAIADTQGTGNLNFGYYHGSANSNICRLDYSNDLSPAPIRTTLATSTTRRFSASTGNNNFGYIAGGGSTVVSFVDRINYSNDTAQASLRGPLTVARHSLIGVTNSSYAWICAGNSITRVDRIDYSNDSVIASIRGNTPSNSASRAGTGNNNFGYFGGNVPSGSGSPAIKRINYANDTAQSVTRASLLLSAYSATGNSNFGYFTQHGGLQVERIDYSNDLINPSIRGPLSYSSAGAGSVTSSSASFGGSPISQYGVFAKPFGYFGGGTPSVVIDRIDYSNDTATASAKGSLSTTTTRSAFGGTGNSKFGYFGGGRIPGPTRISTIDRIDYANDNTTASVRGPLTLSRDYVAAAGNSNFGYFAGGAVDPTYYSIVDRVDYSNDSVRSLNKTFLSIVNGYHGATGNSSYGYFGGGYSPSFAPRTHSRVDRLDYSNDTATAIARNTLTAAKYTTATGNNSFGYFGGGYRFPANIFSTVDRIDYANDTTAISARCSLSSPKSATAATSNQNFGYFGGGAPGPLSTVDRIDYSNDTATASVRGPLSLARSVFAAVSPTAFGGATDFQATSTFFDIQSMKRIEDTTSYSVKKRALGSFGYFGGGNYGNVDRSYLDRINFSNDTATASSRSALISADLAGCAIANNNFGYFKSGRSNIISKIDLSNDLSSHLSISTSIASGNVVGNKNVALFCSYANSVLQRLDYSTDTSFRSRGFLTGMGEYTRSSQIATNDSGYFLGSNSAPNRVEKISYHNDNVRSLIRGNLTISRSYINGGTGNSNYAYIGGDLYSSGRTYFDRINYSNDTAISLIRSNGNSSWANAALSNENFGYWGSGAAAPQQVVRLDYSNDTSNVSGRGNLFNNFNYFAGFTNARFS
jgi:hypothetical protein